MALYGEKTILKLGATTIPDLISISGMDSSVAAVELTVQGDLTKSYRPSQISEAGTLSFSVYYDPDVAVHATIRDYAINTSGTTIPTWTILFSDGTTHVFNAFVVSANLSGMDLEAEVMLEVELRITGVPTITPYVAP
jgi:spore coat protein U-like protein